MWDNVFENNAILKQMGHRKCRICRLSEALHVHEPCLILLYVKLREELLNLEWKIFMMKIEKEIDAQKIDR